MLLRLAKSQFTWSGACPKGMNIIPMCIRTCFLFVRLHGYFFPCCSWLLFPKGRTVRPFECQTVSRGILDVSAPYALPSYELVLNGWEDGSVVLTFLHILATRVVVMSN